MSVSEELLVFTKVPEPGRVKTRLCPPLTPREAAELQAAFVADVMARARELCEGRKGCEARLVVTPGERAEALAAHGVPVEGQVGEGLGERMAKAFERSFGRGAGRVVVRGSDSPLVPVQRLVQAFDALAAPGVDVVLGPDAGGGYFLVGLRRPTPELFRGVSLGSAQEGGGVFGATLGRCADLGLATVVLREEMDVDVAEDLDSLHAELGRNPDLAPGTAECLARIRH